MGNVYGGIYQAGIDIGSTTVKLVICDLREAFLKVFRLDPEKAVATGVHPELIAAEGAALFHTDSPCRIELEKCLRILNSNVLSRQKDAGKRLTPLFRDRDEFHA